MSYWWKGTPNAEKIDIFIKVPMPESQEIGYQWENTRNFIELPYYYFLSTDHVPGT